MVHFTHDLSDNLFLDLDFPNDLFDDFYLYGDLNCFYDFPDFCFSRSRVLRLRLGLLIT